MTDTPYRLADVPEGWTGWIRGRIVGAAPLIAPLSQRPCVYYQLLAMNDGERAAIAHEARGVPITLEDDTGRAVVDPVGAFVHVHYDRAEVPTAVAIQAATGYMRKRAERRPEPAHPLERLGIGHADLLREGILEVGQWITVHGRYLRDVDRDPSRVSDYRSGPPTLVRVGGGGKVQLWVSEVE